MFSNNLDVFLKTFFENNPGAVAVELEWQNCRDSYNADLLNAESKMNIIEADIKRFEGYEDYFDKKWEMTENLITMLLDLKKTILEKEISDVRYKMYSEDLTNKKKALNFGGVSQEQVDLAEIEMDYSFNELNYYKSIYAQTRKYLLESLFVSTIPEIYVSIDEVPALSAENMKEIKNTINSLKKVTIQQELENTKYKMASSGVTTSYLAEYSRNMAKVYELKAKSLEQELFFKLSNLYEKMLLTFSKYQYESRKKEIKLDSLNKLQQAKENGYITSIEYYRGILESYEYDRQALNAEREFILAYIEYLKISEIDPLEGLIKFLDGKSI